MVKTTVPFVRWGTWAEIDRCGRKDAGEEITAGGPSVISPSVLWHCNLEFPPENALFVAKCSSCTWLNIDVLGNAHIKLLFVILHVICTTSLTSALPANPE